jgi:hypothetical protein
MARSSQPETGSIPDRLRPARDHGADGTTLHVQRQIRVVDRTLVFALPKGGKMRRVPLPSGMLAATHAHERAFPSAEVTLPWSEPGGKPVTVRLLVTGDGGRLYTGDLFTRSYGRARSARLA